MKNFDTLTKSEIKKVNKVSNGKLGEYFATPSTIEGFYEVTCYVFDTNYEKIIATVRMSVCLFDRRKSFVCNVEAA